MVAVLAPNEPAQARTNNVDKWRENIMSVYFDFPGGGTLLVVFEPSVHS